jgi:hypothetical protein
MILIPRILEPRKFPEVYFTAGSVTNKKRKLCIADEVEPP